MSLIGALTKAAKAGEAAKKTAPFYSAVDEALAAIARPKGTGAEFLTELTKQPGVKKAELADRKLEQAFKAKGKITKEEAQQILKENPPPKLQEREYNEKMVREEEDIKEELAQQMYGRSYEDLSHRDRRPIFDETQRIMGEENGPQYGDYKTPGGENYREILLKLPSSRPSASNYKDPAKYDADMRAFNASGKKDYQSSHWKEDPNVLAHMRVQDRTGPNGEKVLHVEEIQSDWHQAGRKQGYQKPKEQLIQEARQEHERLLQQHETQLKEKKDSLFNELKDIKNQLRGMPIGASDVGAQLRARELDIVKEFRALDDIQPPEMPRIRDEGVPDAPFKKNWHELAMKRLLNYAADNGYDSIAITPGVEQANRYKLSNQVDQVMATQEEGGLRLFARDKRGNNHDLGVHPSEKLADVVGKDLAEKMATQSKPYEIYQGVDLEVGGEGMKGFYDQILPSYLNTFGKPYGAQVGKLPISHGNKAPSYGLPSMAEFQQNRLPEETMMQYIERMKGEPNIMEAHNFPITPEMRQQIQQKGLPLYQQIGIPTAGAGAASQMPEEPEYGVGGSVAKMEALAKLAKLREEMAPRAEAVKALIAKDENKYLRDVAPNSLTNAEIEAEIARMKARAEASQPEVKKADGGAINFDTAPDMSDGGRIIQGAPFKRGGKVNMTANRDTMFLELSNKKLKRK